MKTHETALNALGDPTRRAILERLRDGPKAVVEIARGLPVGRPAVSQHLKVLMEAGLVSNRAVGNRRVYEVAPDGLDAIQQYLTAFWSEALSGFKQRAERGKDSQTQRSGRSRG